MLVTVNYDIYLIQNKIQLLRMFHLLILIIFNNMPRKTRHLINTKHLTSKLHFLPNFTPDSVADSNYRGKCDVGGF
jgi:hypothetical protein